MLNLEELKRNALENGNIEDPIVEIIVPDLRTGTQYPQTPLNNIAHVTNMAYRSRLLERVEQGDN